MGEKLLESFHGGVVGLPVCWSRRLCWNIGVATCQVPDSECFSDRATGCRNALTLHMFTWYLVPGPGLGPRQTSPLPGSVGARYRGPDLDLEGRAFWGKTEARADPTSAAVNLPPTTGHPPQAALLGVRCLPLLPSLPSLGSG